MALSAERIQEIQEKIKFSLSIFWNSILSDRQALLDVINDILIKIIENPDNEESANINSLVLHARRIYFAEKKNLKRLYEWAKEFESILSSRDSPEIQSVDEESEQVLDNFWIEVPELKLSPTQEKIYLSYKDYNAEKDKAWGFESHY